MLSNNTPFKLKASKSSRVLHDYQTNHCEENYEEEIGDDDQAQSLGVYGGWDGRYRGISRAKQTEFRSSRISDRRISYRGRGGTAVRRNREYLDAGNYYIGSRKYNDSLSRNSEYRSKYGEVEKKEAKLNFPEDPRISKLLRRLSIESDQEASLEFSEKLLKVLLLAENSSYVRKAFHILGESMYDILQISPGPLAKEQAARALGRMGFIMAQENDFERYENWLFTKMQNSNDDLRYLFMKSLKETLSFERNAPKLQIHATELMRELVSMIEITDNPDVFKATLDNLMTLVELYPENFCSQFSNTIDLLFGWHVDPTQPLANIEFVSKNLQRISKHFQMNLDFSVTLIWHFVEDIETYSNSLLKKDEGDDMKDTSSIEQVTVTILALNTVLKCLGEMFHPANNTQVTFKFVTDCLYQIVRTVTDALQQYVSDNLVIAANDSISILLGVVGTKTGGMNESIYNLIDIQLSLINEFLDETIVSMLLMISKVIKELSADLPNELVEKLVGPKSEIIQLRRVTSKSVREATISMYQALLNLKNIPLLQEAYRFVLADLETVYQLILPHIKITKQPNLFAAIERNLEEAELSSLFLFRCLSQLANASGSIIGMWALNPSILELLGVLLEPYNQFLSQNTPSLQYSLLFLLQAHCKCYNYFISSSSLVASKQNKKIAMRQLGLPETLSIVDVATNSPNSGNFSIILQIIYKTLNSKTSLETTILMLTWFNDILAHSETYLELLYNDEDFKRLTEVLVKCGYNVNVQIANAVCGILEKLLSNKQLSWSNAFLVQISDICKMHMNSKNKDVQANYTNLSVNIPWDVAVVEFNKMYTIEHVKQKYSELNQYNNYTILLAQHLHLTGTFYGEMQPLHFKQFMRYLLENKKMNENWLDDLFVCCCPLESDCQENMNQFRELALISNSVLNNWATFEAAQFCVNSKLRTPLGKPNETFTTIESALKKLARELVKVKNDPPTETNINQKQVRLLLQFMEHLEKSIYNASQGCAIAMPQMAKPVRTFFNTNASTCREWLFRIRTVVADLAIHAGESALALRHGEAFLKDLVAANKVAGAEFERTVMQVTLAFLILQESEAIHGLYVWVQKVSGRDFLWVKFAAEQAGKRYEAALAGYRSIVDQFPINKDDVEQKGDDEGVVNLHVKHFVFDQIINCYKELNNWTNLIDFYDEQKSSMQIAENGVRYSFNSVDWDSMAWLFNWDVNNAAFNELATWKDISSQTSWSVFDVQSSFETKLYNVARNIAIAEKSELNTQIDKTLPLIHASIQDNLANLPSSFLQNACLMHYVSIGLKNILNNLVANSVFLVSENFETEINKIDTRVLSKILWWSEFFTKVQIQGANTFSNNLRLDIIKKARKEKNFEMATQHIIRSLKSRDLLYIDENGNQQLAITKIGNSFLQKIADLPTWTNDTARIVTEVIKFLRSCDASPQLTFNLCAATSTAISKYAEMYGGNELRVVSSKILLKLARWLEKAEQVSVMDLGSPLGKLLMVLPEIGVDGRESQVIPIGDLAVGKLLQFSVHQCMGLAKCWFAFGTWCYNWGRKIVDHSSNVNYVLTDEDRIGIKQLLPADIGEKDLGMVFSIMSQTRTTVQEDPDCSEVSPSEIIMSQLQKLPCLMSAPESHLQAMVQIWRNMQKRVYSYYELSSSAYFRYLHLTSNSDVTKTTECNIITITLRLLRLIVKHALELQQVLEEGLETTPTHPWKVIIPQLFSRLNHPESYVRRRVSELLCRIAKDAPHLITFPAVVGALEGGVKFDFSEITLPKDCLSQSNVPREENEFQDIYEKYESDNEDKNVLRTCFKSMVETLSQQAPETITQVQMLVKELRRITLLWDELWLGTLAQHHSEIIRRQQQLEQEIDKVNENPNLSKEEKISLIAEKHRIIIKPIIFILEQLNDITSAEPETPHEKQFHDRYSKMINEVLMQLKNPQHPEKPQESWQPLRTLEKTFQQKFHRRASYSLKMVDISPVLASIKNTLIAMPGLTTSSKTTVTITSISNHVSILPTKTKPKKLIFYGSDGQTYTYLFKGLEDLHLDERIMQFLSIANTMMAKGADATTHNLYRARYYSVIPLGPRSGLISWVDGTTPVFALYKRWQQREATKLNGKTSVTANTTVPRPSELFYNKLNPLLKEHGVKNIENRKEWPLVALKKVLTELMKETPSDLLSRELWCYSVNAANYWQVVKRYSYSVAVMSMIGYIIGLGDRHLDNVLIDLVSGEVVHIDYNVCFEKGKTLRVPEKVPFRLTPNLKDALGVTGVEGIFRLACENVLETMKKGRETLLTLLEAFVYDPLIDWTVGNEVLAGTSFGGLAGNTSCKQSRKDLEKEVVLSMFHVRCTEIKTDWNMNKQEIIIELVNSKHCLQTWLDINKKVTETEDYLKDLHQQMALVKEAEAHGATKHPLFFLPARYEEFRKTKEAMNTSKKDLDSIIHECELHLERYLNTLSTLNSPQFTQWVMEMSTNIDGDSYKIFELIKEFLQNAGQNTMIEQCEVSENEVAELEQQQNMAAQKCLHLLQEYNMVRAQCPLSFIEKHRMSLVLKWCKYLLENKDSCDAVCQQFYVFADFMNNPQVKSVVEFSYNLSVLYNEVMHQMSKVCEEMTKIRAQDSKTPLEKMYTNAKACVSNFLNMEKDAGKAFKFVIITELLLLNQNFLTLETTAHRSGDWLIKLTSRDGIWFLEELVLHSDRAVEILNNLTLQQNSRVDYPGFLQVLHGIQTSNNLYKGLQELHFNFHGIILPESMKKIQNEEPSVLQMIAELNLLIVGIETPITELIAQLEKILPCILMQMEITPVHELILEKITKLRASFLALVHPQIDALSQGQMLLKCFHGLFEKLNQELNNLVGVVSGIEVPASWRKLDQVKEAKSIAAHIFNPKVKAVLDDIFLLKELQTMSEFFMMCVEMSQSFKGIPPVVVYKDEQLVKPIRQFVADFIACQFLGITTETIAYAICYLLQQLGMDVTNEIEQKDIGAESKVPLDELYHKGWALFLKQGTFTQNVYAQASSLETNLKTAWEKSFQEPKKLQQNLVMLESTMTRLQNQITVHNFMFEDILRQHPFLQNICTFIRSKFITDLRAELAILTTVRTKLNEAREQQKTLVASAEQRLKWAAGVNPDLNEVLSAFNNAVASRDKKLDVELQISSAISSTCNIVLQHELLRIQTPETKAFDKLFHSALQKWSAVCQYSNVGTVEVVTPTEENIMKLFTPECLNNPKWLSLITDKISELIITTQKDLTEQKKELFKMNDILTDALDQLAEKYSKHSKLVNDMKSLIKSMTKIEDYGLQTQQFIADYREYIEKFTPLLHNLKKTKSVEIVEEALSNVQYLEEHTEDMYDNFMNLEVKDDVKSRPPLVRQDGVVAAKPPTKQGSLTKGQQRNAYALSVWRRVKMKLEGQDPDPGRKYTTQEQVDYVIQEATNLDNLALLYEGWTPWV